MMNFIMWLGVGVIVGRLAVWITGTREDIMLDTIVAVVGAIMAGLVVAPLLGFSGINQNPFNFPAMLVSAGGAVVLVAVLHLFRRRGFSLH